MSQLFFPASAKNNSQSDNTPIIIQKMLDENSQLVQAVLKYQNQGMASKVQQYLQVLHRNMVFLASVADAVPGTLPGQEPSSSENS